MGIKIGVLAAGISLALLAACHGAEPPAVATVHKPRLFDGLGKIHHPISTNSADAQRYFDQGLALAFGFNHDGAIDAFREAARLQPKCAICWWGVAFAKASSRALRCAPAESSGSAT